MARALEDFADWQIDLILWVEDCLGRMIGKEDYSNMQWNAEKKSLEILGPELIGEMYTQWNVNRRELKAAPLLDR
ncbi:MAG TPA: hypothetical protein VFC78_02855 [Tepidisphaeraceae bacterium]|nr:hypothetical protein [Tepidisphaeraceae bacterium]